MSAYVEPLSEMFTMHQLAEAGDVAERTPADLTDRQIGMLAAYSQADAQQAVQRREKARRARVDADVQQRYTKAMRSAPAAQQAATALTRQDLEALAGGHCPSRLESAPTPLSIIAGVAMAVKKLHHEERQKRLALEIDLAHALSRIETLEAAPAKGAGCHWAGTHEQGKRYEEGCLCTRRGGLWLALKETDQSPGLDPVSWKLIVREGKAQP